MKCLTLFSATARLLWQRFLLAWACRSEFDGELISVCAHTFWSHSFSLLTDLLFWSLTTTLAPRLNCFWMNGATPLLYPKYICFVGPSLQVQPLEKHRLTLGISQKRITPLPNQYMGVTVYPQKWCDCVYPHSHTISPSTSAPGEGGIQARHQTLLLVTVQTHFHVTVYTSLIQKWGKIG